VFSQTAGSYITDPNAVLTVGASYTFDVSMPWYAVTTLDSCIQDAMNTWLQTAGMGTVTGMSRSLFSSDYLINIVPTDSWALSAWEAAILAGFNDMSPGPCGIGLSGATVVSVQAGAESTTIIGNIGGALTSVGTAVGQTAGAAASGVLSQTWPYIVGGIVLYYFLTKKD